MDSTKHNIDSAAALNARRQDYANISNVLVNSWLDNTEQENNNEIEDPVKQESAKRPKRSPIPYLHSSPSFETSIDTGASVTRWSPVRNTEASDGNDGGHSSYLGGIEVGLLGSERLLSGLPAPFRSPSPGQGATSIRSSSLPSYGHRSSRSLSSRPPPLLLSALGVSQTHQESSAQIGSHKPKLRFFAVSGSRPFSLPVTSPPDRGQSNSSSPNSAPPDQKFGATPTRALDGTSRDARESLSSSDTNTPADSPPTDSTISRSSCSTTIGYHLTMGQATIISNILANFIRCDIPAEDAIDIEALRRPLKHLEGGSIADSGEGFYLTRDDSTVVVHALTDLLREGLTPAQSRMIDDTLGSLYSNPILRLRTTLRMLMAMRWTGTIEIRARINN